MLENRFKSILVKDIKDRCPGSIILHINPNEIQGGPDLLILNNNKWAALEVKKSKESTKRPNQDYYVDTMNKMSYAAFVYPENKEEILNELQQTFRTGRTSRVSRGK